MSILLLFRGARAYVGGIRRLLSVRRARRLARHAQRLIEERHRKRRKWAEPVREFLADVTAQLPAVRTAELRPPTATPRMAASLAEALRAETQAVNLGAIEALLLRAYEAAIAERAREEEATAMRGQLALELLAVLQTAQAMEREEEDLWLLALAAAI